MIVISFDIMKILNKEIVAIYQTLTEITNCKDGKQALPDSGKVIYAVVKNLNGVKKVFEEIRDKEWALREACTKAIEADKTKESELTKGLEADLKQLFNVDESEISIHKIRLSAFETLQKFLTGPSTVTLLTYLVDENME